MSFNPASWSTGEDRNVFVPDESERVEIESDLVQLFEPTAQTSLQTLAQTTSATTSAFSRVGFQSASPSEVQKPTDQKKEDDAKLGVAVYTMIDEDDGIGQLLRSELQRDPLRRVSFAAYRIPHRQEAVMKLRFHVNTDVNPQIVLNDAMNRCLDRISAVESALKTAKPRYIPPPLK